MKWSKAWSYLPIDYGTNIGTIENITQRTVIQNNLTGRRLKVRFSNRYNNQRLVLEQVVIGQIKFGSQKIESMQVITCEGKERICLDAGMECYSDEIDWEIEAGTQIVLSVYIKDKVDVTSACQIWSRRSWTTSYGLHGNYAREQHFEQEECTSVYPYVGADCNKSDVIVGVSEILIETEDSVKNITMFGDSITHMSYYSDALLERLMEEYPGKVSVINRGIGGNRVLHDATYLEERPGHGSCFGTAGITRYKKDLFEDNQPDAVLILEGVNDIMHPFQFAHMDEVITAQQLIKAVTQMIEAVHQQGGKVYLGTIMPFKSEPWEWLNEAEAIRMEYNTWVRTQTITEGILDFDKELRDQQEQECLKEQLHIGDGLHPNSEGGKVMASVVPLHDIMEG